MQEELNVIIYCPHPLPFFPSILASSLAVHFMYILSYTSPQFLIKQPSFTIMPLFSSLFGIEEMKMEIRGDKVESRVI